MLSLAFFRKKKQEKEKNKIVDQTVSSKNQEEKKRALDKRTAAQLAYEKTQEKRVGVRKRPLKERGNGPFWEGG